MNIYVSFPLTERERGLIDAVKQPGEQWHWAQDIPQEEHLPVFQKANIVFGNPPANWLEKINTLQWIQLYSAGFDPYLGLDWNNALKHITVTNLRGFFGQPVAESAIAGILALYRKLDELVLLQQKSEWKGAALRPSMHLLFQKNVIVLGAGAIGQTLRDILAGFQCTVAMVGRSQPPTLKDLDKLLPNADIVIAALPDTSETRNLFDAARLHRMKAGAIFVNVGRGTVVSEEALMQALQKKQLGGAVLDVTGTEPIPANHPLWHCPNILLTQHTGGGYDEENADKVRFFIKNLQRFRAGEDLLNRVDFAKGY